MNARAVLVLLPALAACESPDLASETRAITGGTVAGGDPAVVAIALDPPLCGEETQVICTGTLVSARGVVTAAHCLGAGPPELMHVYVGPDARVPGGERIAVVAAHAHPAWDGVAHDIAVLELARPATPAPVALASEPPDAVGRTVRLVGFGADDSGTIGMKREGTALISAIDPDTLAMSPAPAMTCNHDSGGPVFLEVDGVERQVGVTVYGDPACAATGVATRIDAYLQGFIAPAIAAIEAAPLAAPRTPIDPDADYCSISCATDDDCPARMACRRDGNGEARCSYVVALPDSAVASFGETCADSVACGDGVCLPLADGACRCYRACKPPAANGCDAGGPRGAVVVSVVIVLMRRRRSRK